MNKSLKFFNRGRLICEIENDGLSLDFHVPQPNDYFELIQIDKKGKQTTLQYRVHSLLWSLVHDRQHGIFVQSLGINVNLRRLHNNHEWSNQFEPTGYFYLGDIKRKGER